MTPEERKAWSWRNFIEMAVDDFRVHRQFEAETGLRFPSPSEISEAAVIDDECLVIAPLVDFVKWATEQWGIDDAPEAYKLAQRLEPR